MVFPKRFALSTLLLLMLVVASVFGYAQWRKLALKAEIADLNQLGKTTFPALNHRGLRIRMFNRLSLKGDFWPSVEPKKLWMSVSKAPDGRYHIEGRLSAPQEAKAYLEQLRSRLHAVGVQHVVVVAVEPRGNGHWTTAVDDFDLL